MPTPHAKVGAARLNGPAGQSVSLANDIVAGEVSPVVVHLEGTSESGTGSVAVTGTINVCPVIDELTVAPLSVHIGSSIALSSAARDPNEHPAELAYYWSITGGAIDDPIAPQAVLTSETPGTFDITLTVSDGSTATATQRVTCIDPDAPDGGSVGPEHQERARRLRDEHPGVPGGHSSLGYRARPAVRGARSRGDHGDLPRRQRRAAARPRRRPNLRGSKGSVYEGGVRVPLFAAGASVTRRGRDNSLVAAPDVFATVLDVAGAASEAHDRYSIKPVLSDARAHSGRVHSYTEIGVSAQHRYAIKDTRYKLAYPAAGRFELYDLVADPLETTNLYNSAPHAAALASLRDELTELEASASASYFP